MSSAGFPPFRTSVLRFKPIMRTQQSRIPIPM
jgi:hypothetical protein